MTLSYSGYVKYHYVAAPILSSAPTIRKLSVYGTFSNSDKAMMKRSSVAIMNLSYNGYINYRHNEVVDRILISALTIRKLSVVYGTLSKSAYVRREAIEG